MFPCIIPVRFDTFPSRRGAMWVNGKLSILLVKFILLVSGKISPSTLRVVLLLSRFDAFMESFFSLANHWLPKCN